MAAVERRGPTPEREASNRRLRHGQTHVVVSSVASDSGLPPIDNGLISNRVSVMQREHDLGPGIAV